MKKLICLIIAFAICITVVGVVFYQLGFENAKKETEAEKMTVNDPHMDEAIGKTDYPLIDIAFNDGNEWAVLIVDGIYSENKTYLLCRDGRELQLDKEYLSVITYPAGRGTTGVGRIVVYRNGEVIKDIEYFEIDFVKEELKSKFEEVSEEELNEFIRNNE